MANNEAGNLGSVVLKKVIGDALNKMAKSSNNSLEKSDVPAIQKKVATEVTAVVANATNSEPWYQSRVIIGTTVSMVLMGAGFIGLQTDVIQPGEITDFIMDAGALLAAGYALFGRLKAGLKPIGE